MNEALLRELIPAVTGVLVRRGADFAAAEDAVQEALVQALASWPGGVPADPKGWLITVAWRKFLDATRAESSRQAREARLETEPPPGPAEELDDTLQLYFRCAHPSLSAASAVALTLRAVGGLTTRQIAEAYLVPEATMAQRISRAKRTVSGVRFDEPGRMSTVLRVLYLVFNEGYSGKVDLADEAIRLARQLRSMTDDEEVSGLLALMLLHRARRAARTTDDGALVPLAEQDRTRWDTALVAEGVEILQSALARDRLGEYQAQAAIAALHADAQTADQTDWPQIVEWYDELVRLTDSPVVRLNRAVAVGEADGPQAGLAALAQVDPGVPRRTAVEAHLRERSGEWTRAASLYADAARAATNLAERDHLTRRAARLNARVTVRPREATDLPVLLDLLQRTHEREGYPVRASAVRADWLAAPDELHGLVAEHDGRVVGHLALHPTAVPGHDEGEDAASEQWQQATGVAAEQLAVVSRFVTDRSVPGTGTLLLAHAVQLSADLGRVPVLLVDPDSAAGAFYLRRGWRAVGTARQQWGPRSVDAVLMVGPVQPLNGR